MTAVRRPRGAQQQPARGSREAGRRRARQGSPRSELLGRVLVAIPAAVITIVFIDLGGLPFALFLIAAGWICMHELYRMQARLKPAALVGFAALAGMVLAAHYGGHGGQRQVLEVAVGALPVTLIVVAPRSSAPGARPGAGATLAIAGTLLGIYWLGFAFAHAELLRRLPHGDGVIIDVLIGTFLGDTGAYFGGRLFGRRPLAPRISPSKTVEGLFCGMLFSIVAVFVAALYQTWLTRGDALLLGLAVAILGPLGDLFESLLKRDAGAKDTGHLFGAHGGALDRADAVLFTIVAGYYIWVAVMH